MALAVAYIDVVVPLLREGDHFTWLTAGRLVVIVVAAALAPRLPLAAFTVALPLGLPGGGQALLMWTGYQVGRQVVTRPGAAVAVAATLACLGVEVLFLSPLPGIVVFEYVIFAGLPVLLGRYVAEHMGLKAARDAQRRQLRRERGLLVDRERLQERLRIARDVHDSLGHQLSLISIQAAALEVTGLPPRHRKAIGDLAATARQAADELHDLVGGLRGRSDPEARSLGDVDALVARFRAAGTPVTVLHEDTPRPLTPAAADAAYRVVEEGLTNAAKHAPGLTVTVSLRAEGDTLLVTVGNPLPPIPGVYGEAGSSDAPDRAHTRARVREATGSPRRPLAHGDDTGGREAVPSDAGECEAGSSDAGVCASRTGYGLTGLDERVLLAGGALHVASSGGEFRVVAMLPISEDGDEEPGPEMPAGRRRLWTGLIGLAAIILVLATGPADFSGG
ncbi:hypothetical protein Ssi02_61840 [Sinosporangium siamense]|uniref:histidine kinase n=1 Tax=Sinosporangium siamense TaxID=1367973 RepID=A0A919RLG7_9ACTN|nr:hypothetical protein Ssi02_61840 [Sinosporangium siamense]